MSEFHTDEKKIVLLISGLLLLAIALTAVKYSLPKTADSFIHAEPLPIVNLDQNPDYKPKPIDINTASADALVELSGIGEVIAARIIEYRREFGPFRSEEDLLKVKGIGPKKLNSIKDRITLK